MNWDPSSERTAVELYEKGYSLGHIAAAIGAPTRMAVASKIQRMGVRRPRTRGTPFRPPVAQPDQPAPASSFFWLITDLGNNQCRYSDCTEAPFFFCGEVVTQGSWCDDHREIVFTTLQKKKEEALAFSKLKA